MKHLLILFFLVCPLACAPAAEQILLSDGAYAASTMPSLYTVPAGQSAVLEAIALSGSSAQLRVGGARIPAHALAGRITAPAGTQIRVDADNGESGSLAFAQLRVAPVSGSTVTIPAEGGPVRVILESSADLLTWTPSAPGEYGEGTDRRFFRVRLEAAP